MSIYPNCPNRIKPKLLREQKTEALLVFIRTTLEQSFDKIEQENFYLEIGTPEDTKYIYDILKDLRDKLKECVVNSSYLQSIIANSGKNAVFSMLANKERPLMIYYDSIVKEIEINLSNGTQWIPELMVISLLSQWILEEEKSVYLYPFLKDINYIELIDIYDKSKQNEDENKKEVVMNMYRLSTKLIEKLKKASVKISKKQKKRRK